MNIDRDTFINTFVINFLSSWCATHFEDYCSRGLQGRLEDPPVDDAMYLAERAWERLQNR